jgi:hypothetical protein
VVFTEVDLVSDATSLIEWLREFHRLVHTRTAGLDEHTLNWRPHADMNSIGVTLWHFSRWWDLIAVTYLDGQPTLAHHWWSDGWAARTGYDPTGLGTRGLGVLTGYTPQEARRVPPMPLADLLVYFDSVIAHTIAALATVSPERLEALAPGEEPGDPSASSLYLVVRNTIRGSIQHVGEIEALTMLRRLTFNRTGPTPQDPAL